MRGRYSSAFNPAAPTPPWTGEPTATLLPPLPRLFGQAHRRPSCHPGAHRHRASYAHGAPAPSTPHFHTAPILCPPHTPWSAQAASKTMNQSSAHTHGSTEALGQTHVDRIHTSSQFLQCAVLRGGRVPQPCSVQVHLPHTPTKCYSSLLFPSTNIHIHASQHKKTKPRGQESTLRPHSRAVATSARCSSTV